MSSTPAPIQRTETVWHTLTPPAALDALKVNADGLSAEEARRRRKTFGANRLPKPPRVGPLVVFVRQFKNPLIYLLVAAAIVSLGIGELRDAAFIAGVLLFSGSLYLLAFTGIRWLGAVTPLGGVCFLAGWLCLMIGSWRALS